MRYHPPPLYQNASIHDFSQKWTQNNTFVKYKYKTGCVKYLFIIIVILRFGAYAIAFSVLENHDTSSQAKKKESKMPVAQNARMDVTLLKLQYINEKITLNSEHYILSNNSKSNSKCSWQNKWNAGQAFDMLIPSNNFFPHIFRSLNAMHLLVFVLCFTFFLNIPKMCYVIVNVQYSQNEQLLFKRFRAIAPSDNSSHEFT